MIRKPFNLSIFIRGLQKIAPGKGKKPEFTHPVACEQAFAIFVSKQRACSQATHPATLVWLQRILLSQLCIIMQILVYIFCLISIGLSLSDEANKMKFLNIERAKQFQLSLKI